MTGLFFNNPDIGEEAALRMLAEPYGEAAGAVQDFWRLTSEAMDLFPWEASWLIRAVGTSDPAHSLSAALVRGVPWHTPSWASTRRNTFMVVDTAEHPDPWMLEDIQLRCGLAADRMARALEAGEALADELPQSLALHFAEGLRELREWRRRTLAYTLHTRETNLATVMREIIRQGRIVPDAHWDEMRALLEEDRANQGQDEPVASALQLLQHDRDCFLGTYFLPGEDTISKGYTSLTSR